MATRAELEAGLQEALDIDDLDLAEQFGAKIREVDALAKGGVDSRPGAVGGMYGRGSDLNLDPQTQTTGDAARQAVRTFFRRVPGTDYALGAGRYLENAISGKPSTFREALDTERQIQQDVAAADTGAVSYAPEAAMIAKLPYAAAKGARGLFARALGAGGTTAAGEFARGEDAGKALKSGAETATLAAGGELTLGKLLPIFSKVYRGKAAKHALKGTQASANDADLLRDRMGNPTDVGQRALDMRTPTGEPTLPAFAHPETRLQNVQDTLGTIGPLKTALVEKAPGEINTARLEQTIQGRVKALDTRAEKFASGEKNIDQARGIFQRYKDQYRQEPRVIGVTKDVNGATVAGGPDLSKPVAEAQLPHANDYIPQAGAELDEAAMAASEADRAAARLRSTEARDANMDLDRAGSLEAAQIAADTRRRVTQAAQDRAATAAQNADEAQRSFDAVNDANREGVYLDPADTEPYRRQAQGEIDQAAANATAADRNAVRARNNADPLERLDDGRTEVGVINEDGTRSTTAFEQGGESNIGRSRRAAGMSAQHAEQVEAQNASNLVHQNYGTDDVRLDPDTMRPRGNSGWRPVIDRQDPMSVAEADAAYQALTDDVYNTASSRYPDRGAKAIDADPELRLKKVLAADLLAEIEATINQNVPHGVGPLTPEGARYKELRGLYETNKAFEPALRDAANRAAVAQGADVSPWVLRHGLLPAAGFMQGGLKGAVAGAAADLGTHVGIRGIQRYGHPALARGYEGLANGMDLARSIDPVTLARIAALEGSLKTYPTEEE